MRGDLSHEQNQIDKCLQIFSAVSNDSSDMADMT
jgi:hypothetical protein